MILFVVVFTHAIPKMLWLRIIIAGKWRDGTEWARKRREKEEERKKASRWFIFLKRSWRGEDNIPSISNWVLLFIVCVWGSRHRFPLFVLLAMHIHVLVLAGGLKCHRNKIKKTASELTLLTISSDSLHAFSICFHENLIIFVHHIGTNRKTLFFRFLFSSIFIFCPIHPSTSTALRYRHVERYTSVGAKDDD